MPAREGKENLRSMSKSGRWGAADALDGPGGSCEKPEADGIAIPAAPLRRISVVVPKNNYVADAHTAAMIAIGFARIINPVAFFTSRRLTVRFNRPVVDCVITVKIHGTEASDGRFLVQKQAFRVFTEAVSELVKGVGVFHRRLLNT